MDIGHLLVVNCKFDIITIKTQCNYMTWLLYIYSDMQQPCILLSVHSQTFRP